jgi:hypothetical protein
MQVLTLLIKSHVGYFELSLSESQQLLFEIITSENNIDSIEDKWIQLWDKLDDYELLDNASKSVMSLTVSKLSKNLNFKTWDQHTKNNPYFLVGLPKYAWTKNNLLIKKFKDIHRLLNQERIEHLPILDTAEILISNSSFLSCIFYNIHIACCHSEQEKSHSILNQKGWNLLYSTVKKTVYHSKNESFNLHIHTIKQEELIELHKNKIITRENIYLPSLINQTKLLINELHDVTNWAQSNHLKLLCLLREKQKQLTPIELHELSKIDKNHNLLTQLLNPACPKQNSFSIKLTSTFLIGQYLRIEKLKSFVHKKNRTIDLFTALKTITMFGFSILKETVLMLKPSNKRNKKNYYPFLKR